LVNDTFFIYLVIMILVIDVWNRLLDYSQKYQSGIDTVSYFNSKLQEVQLEIFNDFSPLYDESEKVKTLLDIWVSEQATNSDAVGYILAGGSDTICRPLSIGYTDGNGNVLFPIYEIDESELIAIERMPQRQPNVTNKNVYYRFNAVNNLQFYPKATTPFDMFYLMYPTAASIAFTLTETDDEDVMTYDAGSSVNLNWPEAAFDLIVYKMLEKYGVSVREDLLQQYARFGFSQTATIGEEKGK